MYELSPNTAAEGQPHTNCYFTRTVGSTDKPGRNK
jgi:hypothetical protein